MISATTPITTSIMPLVGANGSNQRTRGNNGAAERSSGTTAGGSIFT
jgi:hypothetical protein